MRDGDWQDYRAGNAAPREVWIVGDGAYADVQIAVEAAGLRVARRFTCAEALAAFEPGLADRLVLLELSGSLSADEDAVVDRIAGLEGGVAIVTFSLAVLDTVLSRLWVPFVTMLCEPDMADRIAAISLASLPVASRVAESNDRTEAIRLQKMSSEIARIARVLADLVDESGPGRLSVSDGLTGYRPPPDATGTIAVTSGDIRTMIRLRRQRDAVFGDGLFGDPVWDMMLDLAAARLEGTQVAVSSLCIAAAVPPTTALRWIAALTAAGTIVRVPDEDDRRRVFLELSEAAAATVLDFLGKAKRAGLALV